MTIRRIQSKPADNRWFFFTVLFIIIDYGRPQDILPIGFLRPAMVINLILIYYIFTNFNYGLFRSRQIKLIMYIIALLAVFIPVAVNNYYALQTTKLMLLYMPFILSVVATVNTLQRLKTLMFVFICLMFYVTIYCATHAGTGSGNYFADENDVSLYILMYLPFCYFFLASNESKFKKLVYFSCAVMGLVSIVISFSRGGFVGLLAVGFFIWITSDKKKVTFVVVSMAALIFYFSVGEKYLAEMRTVTDLSENTANLRIEYWGSALRMFLDNPLGVGGGNFLVRFPEYQGTFFQRGMWGRAAHSLWFTLFPELGVVGIIIYFSLMKKNFMDLFRLRKLGDKGRDDFKYIQLLAMGMIASFVGYFTAGTFISVLYYAHYWYLTAILVAAVNISENLLNNTQNQHISK